MLKWVLSNVISIVWAWKPLTMEKNNCQRVYGHCVAWGFFLLKSWCWESSCKVMVLEGEPSGGSYILSVEPQWMDSLSHPVACCVTRHREGVGLCTGMWPPDMEKQLLWFVRCPVWRQGRWTEKAVVCPCASVAPAEGAAITGRVVVLGKMVGIALVGTCKQCRAFWE